MRDGSTKTQSPPVHGVESSWLSAVLLLPALTLFGEILIAKTHHRPLAAATFASIAVVTWFCMEVFTRRALHPGVQQRALARKWAWRLGLGVDAALFLWAFLEAGLAT